jgi:hypothetical protein
MVQIYCGSKQTPAGKVRGTAAFCYKRGRRAGFAGAISKNFITKAEVAANHAAMGQRMLQAIAKALGLPKYSEKKALIVPRILGTEWVRLNAKDILIGM